jgi:gliding motility-associated-like protein
MLNGCAPFQATYDAVVVNALHPLVSVNSWEINNEQVSQSQQLYYRFDHPGSYIVKSSVTSVRGCINTITLSVIAYPQPKADFTFSPGKPVESFDRVTFVPYEDETLTGFSWYFINNDPLNRSRITSPDYLFEQAGTYPVALLVTNQWGCEDTIVKTITIEPDFSVYVPNAFTPNYDGKNELFYPVTRGAKLLRFMVYDRWGEKLYETTDLGAGWDGTYKGEACKQDVYVWKLNVSGRNGEEKKLSGTVTLFRSDDF